MPGRYCRMQSTPASRSAGYRSACVSSTEFPAVKLLENTESDGAMRIDKSAQPIHSPGTNNFACGAMNLMTIEQRRPWTAVRQTRRAAHLGGPSRRTTKPLTAPAILRLAVFSIVRPLNADSPQPYTLETSRRIARRIASSHVSASVDISYGVNAIHHVPRCPIVCQHVPSGIDVDTVFAIPIRTISTDRRAAAESRNV